MSFRSFYTTNVFIINDLNISYSLINVIFAAVLLDVTENVVCMFADIPKKFRDDLFTNLYEYNIIDRME